MSLKLKEPEKSHKVKTALKVIGALLLALACFAIPLLLAFGINPPLGYRFNSFSAQGLLSVWWGRLLLIAYWFAIGWLVFWGFVIRNSDQSIAEKQKTSSPFSLGRLRGRAARKKPARFKDSN